MGGMLASPFLWIGFGLVLMAVVLLTGGGERKRQAARLARVTRRAPRSAGVVDVAQSLRRRDPNEGSALGQFLANFSSIEKLQGRLEIAGMSITPQKFLIRALMIGLGVALLLLLAGKSLLLALLVGILLGLGLPHFYVGRRIKKRQLMFLKQFPEAIDLIVRGLRAGLPVGESFQTVAKEIPAPVGSTFGTISQQVQLGLPMEKALADTAQKLGMTEFNFFVTTIILQRETGGNLGEILNNLAEVLRARQMMKLKIGALSSEARASGFIVGSLPIFVFIILSIASPKYLAPFYDDFRGNLAFMVALGMMSFGGFVMKRMTQLEI